MPAHVLTLAVRPEAATQLERARATGIINVVLRTVGDR